MFTCTAGDVFEWTSAARTSRIDDERKAEYLAEALELMDYDAIALGEKDLAYGRSFLRRVAEKHGLRFVCANAVDGGTKELLFPPYVVRERDGVKVAFVGVVSPERHITAQVDSAILDDRIEIRDPTEMVREILAEVRDAADLVVLLSHTGIENSEFLAEDLEVDVVVVGHYPAIQTNPRKIGDAVFAMAGAKSDRFGTLDLTLTENGIAEFTGDAVRLLQKGPEDSRITEIAARAEREDKEIRRERQLAAQREREIETQRQTAMKVHERGGVFGAESCRTCHEPIYDNWMQTPHATAFATLAEADAWDDPDCIGCHVTGIEDKKFVADVNVPPEVWNVQCEECHGSGLYHARDGSYVTAGEATCRRCHDPDNSPEFEYELYRSFGVH